MTEDAAVNPIITPQGIETYHYGPSLEAGPLPTLFYFALSAHESLNTDPYNQPVLPLREAGIRTFSLTLPYHGEGYVNQEAVPLWAQALTQNSPFLEDFLSGATDTINYLIEQGYIDNKRIAATGLSRGGLIAAHLAARHPAITQLLAFAPMTSFEHMEEFKDKELPPQIAPYSLLSIVDKLADTTVRIYIGNRDTRVGTRQCFQFISALTEAAYNSGVRSPPVELILTPSVGYRGHGTPKSTFLKGSKWLQSQLKTDL